MKLKFYYGNICLIFCTFFTLQASAQSEEKIIKMIADEVMTNSKAYSNLRQLCKQVGPRVSGSAGADKAIQMAKAMLINAGADTVYLQPCKVTHWERGQKESAFLQAGNGAKVPLQICALGNAVGTGSSGVRAAVVEVNNMAALKQLGRKGIEGKIVFFNIAMNPTYISTSQAYGESGIGRRSGPSQAAKYGAVGVVVRSLSSNIDAFPHTGATVYNDSFPKIPAIAISTLHAEMLSSELKKKEIVSFYFKTNCKLLPDANSFNVIGEIRGSQFPEEIITVGGHLDSWDLAEGAQDDGAGCMQSIEVIRVMQQLNLRPKRTIRAVMFMNEENGLGGAKAYLQQALQNKERHIFALESDGGGFTPRGFTLDMSDKNMLKVQAWAPLFYQYGVYDFKAGGGGADIQPLKQIGAALSGLSPDNQRYFDIHHAATDVFENVSKRELDLGAVNMAAFVWLVSEFGLN